MIKIFNNKPDGIQRRNIANFAENIWKITFIDNVI